MSWEDFERQPLPPEDMTCRVCKRLVISDGPFRNGDAYPSRICFVCKEGRVEVAKILRRQILVEEGY